MYFIIRYPPRIALNTNPMNPIADTSQTFGPLSAKIAREKRQIHNYGQTLQYLSVNKSRKKQAENQEGYSELEQYHQPT